MNLAVNARKILINMCRHTSRMSAALFYSSLHKTSLADDVILRQKFYNLCKDESALVRRTAASVLCSLIHDLPEETISSDIVPIYKRLSSDDQAILFCKIYVRIINF